MEDEIEVGKLYVPVEYDLEALNRQAGTDLKQRAEKHGAEFSESVVNRVRQMLGGGSAKKKITDAGVELSKNLRAGLERDRGDIIEQWSRKQLSRGQAERQWREAGERYKKALLDGIEREGAAGRLTDKGFTRLTGDLQRVGRESGEGFSTGFSQTATSGFEKFNRWVRVGFGLVFANVIIQSLRAIGSAIDQLVADAGKLDAMRRNFENVNVGRGLVPADTLREMQQGAAGTVEAVTLMREAQRLLNTELPVTAQSMGELTMLARRLGEAYGFTAEEGLSRMIRAVTKLEPELLDEIGLTVKVEQATKAWADANDRNVNSLTPAERMLAFYNATLEQAREKVTRLGEEQDHASVSIEQAKTAWANFRVELASAILKAPFVEAFFRSIGAGALDSASKVQTLTNKIGAMIDVLPNITGSGIAAAATGAGIGGAVGGPAGAVIGGTVGLGIGAGLGARGASAAEQQRIDEARHQRNLRTIRAMTDINALQREQNRLVAAMNQVRERGGTVGRDRVVELAEMRARLEQLRNAPKAGGTTGGGTKVDPGTLAAIRAETDLSALLTRQIELRQRLNDEKNKATPDKKQVGALTGELREVTQRISQLKSGNAAVRKATGERERLMEQAQRHADEMERALGQLTLSVADEALTQIDKLEREARETFTKLGQALPQALIDGFAARRDAIRQTIRFEDLTQRGEDLGRAVDTDMGGTWEARRDLAALIETMREEAAQLPENSKLRERYTDAVARMSQVYDRAVGRVVKANENEIDSQMKLREEQERTRQERLRRIQDSARDIEQGVRGAAQIAEGLGIIDDEGSRAVQTIGQLAAGISQVAGLMKAGELFSTGGLAALASLIGAAVQLGKAIFGGEDTQAAAQRASIINQNTRALRELRDALLRSISVAEKEDVAAAGASFIQRMGGVEQLQSLARFGPGSPTGLTQADRDFLERLEQLTGAEFWNNGVLNIEEFLKAWQAFLDTPVGAFGVDLQGRLDALDYAAQVAGDALGDAATRMRLFIEAVRQFSPEFAAEFDRILREQGADAARAWLQQQAVMLATSGPGALGAWARNLTPEEIQRIIAEALERIDALGEGGAVGGSTQNATIQRGITELSANRLIGYAATQVHWLERIAEYTHAAARALGANVVLPTIHPPTPEQVAGGQTTVAGVTSYNFGANSVVITVPAGADPYLTGEAVGRGFRRGVESYAATDEGLGRRTIDILRASGRPGRA